MIGVLHVLEVELPVVRHHLRAAPEQHRGPVHHAQQPAGDVGAEIGLEVGCRVAERAEHQAAEFGDAQALEPVLVLAELRRHAALALHAVLERDAGELAGEVVGPAVIDAGEFLDAAGALQAQQVAAMGAAVDEGVDRAGRVAHDDDRGLADGGRDVVAGFGEFHREAEVVPGGSLEQALLLALVLRGVGIDPEGHLADAVRRPGDAGFRGQTGLGHGGAPSGGCGWDGSLGGGSGGGKVALGSRRDWG